MPDTYRWPTEVIQKLHTHMLIEEGMVVSLYIPLAGGYAEDQPSRQYRVVEILDKNPKEYQVRLELIL